MFYVCSHGVKIAVYDPNPHGRETVLLLHGWPMTHDLFEYQTGPLIQAGYRPVLLDLRGFGKSDAPALGYTYDDMAADLRSVIQTLHLSGVILVGYGMAPLRATLPRPQASKVGQIGTIFSFCFRLEIADGVNRAFLSSEKRRVPGNPPLSGIYGR